MKYTFTKITAHNLVAQSAEDERYVVVSSGFDGQVLVIREDGYGDYDLERMPVRQCERKFGIKLTKES